MDRDRRGSRIADGRGTLPRGRHFLAQGRQKLSRGADFCIIGWGEVGKGALFLLPHRPSVKRNFRGRHRPFRGRRGSIGGGGEGQVLPQDPPLGREIYNFSRLGNA